MYTAGNNFNSSHVATVVVVRGALLHYISTDPNLLTKFGTIVSTQVGIADVIPCQDVYSFLVKFTEEGLRKMGMSPYNKDGILAHLRMTLYNSLKDFYYQEKDKYNAVRYLLEKSGNGQALTVAMRTVAETQIDFATKQRFEQEYMSALSCLSNIVDLGGLTYKICL